MEITNAQFAQGLRELAEIYERHPEMAHPERIDVYLALAKPEQFRDSVRALASAGKVEKIPPRNDTDYFYTVRLPLPSGVVVELSTARNTICRRVRKMQMVDTWECPDSLLDPEAVNV